MHSSCSAGQLTRPCQKHVREFPALDQVPVPRVSSYELLPHPPFSENSELRETYPNMPRRRPRDLHQITARSRSAPEARQTLNVPAVPAPQVQHRNSDATSPVGALASLTSPWRHLQVGSLFFPTLGPTQKLKVIFLDLWLRAQAFLVLQPQHTTFKCVHQC